MKHIFYRMSGGILLIVVGLLFWLSNLDVLDIAWHRDWPIIVIVVGLLELVKHITKKKA